MKRIIAITLLLMFAQGLTAGADPPQAERFARRWVYSNPGFDLRKDDQAEQLLALIARASKAGYNGITVRTNRLIKFDYLPPAVYYRNAERVRKAAEAADIEVIPLAMRLNGFSNGTMSNNPNLAEGMPVRDYVFEVHDGQATVADSQNLLPFGDFEVFSVPDRPDRWDFTDGPGKVSFEDREVRHTGDASLRMENFSSTAHGNGRVFKKVKLKPWHQYYVKVWIKTENVKSPGMIWVRAHEDVAQQKRFNLHRAKWDVRPTQDWKRHHAVFNTLHNSEVWLYIGGWQLGGGKMWLDDISLQEVAGINLLRREGCPVRVTSEDGSVEYEEGTDFELCNRPGVTTGQVLAECTHRCTDIIRRVDPAAEIVNWSDMFDPNHNAVDNYWLTRGTMKGPWEGVDKDVLIGNWNRGHKKPSLKFFSDRGHRQMIATYYDSSNWQRGVRSWLTAAEGVPGVDGIMYTTWSNDYRHLEEFMQIVR